MDILIVDPANMIAPVVEAPFRDLGWRTHVTQDRERAFGLLTNRIPDLILVHGDGPSGEACHLCQRFKLNPLTAGIPIMLIEDSVPPAWVLTGMPVDAVTQAPWDATDVVHHLEVLVPTAGTGVLDDLTNFPRRRSISNELERRMMARELFAVGLVSLREADAYRQDFGRTGLDQFIVLISVLLRRNASSGTPVSIGYLDEGGFIVLGAPSSVHELVALTIRDFEALIPAFYEMDALFGNQEPETGPPTWIGVQGSVSLIEPGRFDNALQIGFVLAENLTIGNDVVRHSSEIAEAESDQVAAD